MVWVSILSQWWSTSEELKPIFFNFLKFEKMEDGLKEDNLKWKITLNHWKLANLSFNICSSAPVKLKLFPKWSEIVWKHPLRYQSGCLLRPKYYFLCSDLLIWSYMTLNEVFLFLWNKEVTWWTWLYAGGRLFYAENIWQRTQLNDGGANLNDWGLRFYGRGAKLYNPMMLMATTTFYSKLKLI